VLRFDGSYKIPPNYADAFKTAEATFLHQRVFCPTGRRLVMSNEPVAQLSDAVQDSDHATALAIANGSLDPISRDTFVPTPREDMVILFHV